MNIYQKLVAIRSSIDGFTKDTNGFNYKYVSGTQVLSKIYDKMNELQIILEPHVLHEKSNYQIFEYDTTDKFGKVKHNIDYLVNAPMEYVWINAENPEEKSIVPWGMFGQQDEISKAFGSGLTYSERYFLMKYFNVPTDADDPDSRQKQKEDAYKTLQNASQATQKTGNTNTPSDSKQTHTDDILQCSSCHTKITQAVHDWSVRKYGKQLCTTCQKKGV